jgi:hypothetical protein
MGLYMTCLNNREYIKCDKVKENSSIPARESNMWGLVGIGEVVDRGLLALWPFGLSSEFLFLRI